MHRCACRHTVVAGTAKGVWQVDEQEMDGLMEKEKMQKSPPKPKRRTGTLAKANSHLNFSEHADGKRRELDRIGVWHQERLGETLLSVTSRSTAGPRRFAVGMRRDIEKSLFVLLSACAETSKKALRHNSGKGTTLVVGAGPPSLVSSSSAIIAAFAYHRVVVISPHHSLPPAARPACCFVFRLVGGALFTALPHRPLTGVYP